MKQRGCSCIAVNSHSRESINEVVRAVLVSSQVHSKCIDLPAKFMIIMRFLYLIGAHFNSNVAVECCAWEDQGGQAWGERLHRDCSLGRYP